MINFNLCFQYVLTGLSITCSAVNLRKVALVSKKKADLGNEKFT